MKTLIKNGTVVSETGCERADVLVEGEIIKNVSAEIKEDADRIFDATGKYILPGGVDVHTHMDLDVGFDRACDDFYTGTVAAVCGGTTTIVDHMAFGPEGCGLFHQVEEYHRLADGASVADYGFHGVIQHVNGEVLSDMKRLCEDEGITSFKVYLTYDRRLDDRDLFCVLKKAKETGALIAAHCENDGVITALREELVRAGKGRVRYHPLSRPPLAEAEAINRMSYLAEAAVDAPFYVVHLSSRAGLSEALLARKRGLTHFGIETCPQYMFLSDEVYEDDSEGLKYVLSPPLRKKEDTEAIKGALTDGVIDVVATDHCPFTFGRQKQRGAHDFTLCPNGIPGVEERMILLLDMALCDEGFSLPAAVRCLCSNPARIFGLYPKKGRIGVGADADILILNPKGETLLGAASMHGAADYSCYEGRRCRGEIEYVFLRGEIMAESGRFVGRKGCGGYLFRGRSSLA